MNLVGLVGQLQRVKIMKSICTRIKGFFFSLWFYSLLIYVSIKNAIVGTSQD